LSAILIILISSAMMASFFVLFISIIACNYCCTALCLLSNWLGWGLFITAVLTICGKAMEFLLKKVVSVILKRLPWYCTKSRSTAGTNEPDDQKRFLRQFVNIGIIVLSGYIAFLGLSEGLSPPQVKEVEIKIAGLHPDLEGLNIAQISDLHIFLSVRCNWLEQIVDQVNAFSPDIIAITGDLSDSDYSQFHKDVAPLAKLRAKYGKFFVTGNHDYTASSEIWNREMKDIDVTVLQNEHQLITQGEGLILLGGVSDYSDPDSSPAKAMGLNPKADLKILLAHQPRSIYDAAKAGFDLQLSGHTHGGVLSPVRWLAGFLQPFQSGLYKYKSTQIYVSNGTGFWGIPFRLGTPLEISLLKLTSGYLEN
jgi:predicted MPP superfamily phosphohydrolase